MPLQLLVRGLPHSCSLDRPPLRPSHGVSLTFQRSDSGSDLHRICLTRLCCVLRLSQPLDALFRPNLRSLISYRNHSGFCLQRVSLHDSLVRLSAPAAPLAVHRRCLATSPPQLQGLMHSRSPYFQVGVTRTLQADPLLTFTPPRCFSSASAPLRVPPLMGFSTPPSENRGPLSSPCLLCRVSKNRGVDALFRARLPP